MKRKIKNCIYFFSFIITLFFLLTPMYTTQASLSDNTSIDAGIKIVLGSVDLEVNNASSEEGLFLGDGITEVQLKDTVQNKGTLAGKLAYKLNVKKEDGTTIDSALLKSLKITINNQELNIDNLDYYATVPTQSGEDFELFPKETPKEISMKIELTTDVLQTQTINIEVEYMLFQMNGTIEKPLFHDVKKAIHEIILNKELIDSPEQGKSYWPNSGWIDHGNIRYNKDSYNPIMYFSEIEGTNSKQIKNLNDAIFYVEIKSKMGVDLTDLTIRFPEDMIMKVEYVDNNKQRLKITLSIDKTKFNRDVLSVPIYDYSIAYNKENSFEFSQKDAPITLKRVLLSTDDTGPRQFKMNPISLFEEKRELFLTQTMEDNTLYLHENLSQIKLDKKVETEVNVSGENKNLIHASTDHLLNSQFSLEPKNSINHQINGMNLTISLKGNSGEVLEVKRKIQLMPVIQEAQWPKQLNAEWGIPNEVNEYNQSVWIDLIEDKGKMTSRENFYIYVKNTHREKLTFSISDSEHFILQNIGYNSSGNYMRVALKFNGSNTNEANFPRGFNFSVQKEVSTECLNNEKVEVSYSEMRTAKQQKELSLQKEYSFVSEFNVETQIIQPIKNGETELYIYYDQLIEDYKLEDVKEEMIKYFEDYNISLTFLLEDELIAKALKLTIQE